MRKVIFPLTITLMMTACTKEDLPEDILYPDQVINGDFENIDLATSYWTSSGEGSITLSTDEAFNGSFAMAINPTECFEVSYTNSLAVEANATYELSFVTKILGSSIVCLAEFYLVLEQDGESILEVNIAQGTALDWDQRVLYVQTESSSPITLKIFTGSEAVLLDDVRFQRISSI